MAQYLTVEEMPSLGINAKALERVPLDDLTLAVEAASSEADCYLSALYDVPMTAVPLAVKKHVANVAVYHLMSVKGFSPAGSDQIIVDNYDRAIRFFKDIQKQGLSLSTPETQPAKQDSVYVVSRSSPRRW